jgi:ubiquinone/menaquinone biosynthesis C-methylase UbiE
MKALERGDFTGLAHDYSRYRPDYSQTVLRMLLGAFNRPAAALDVADVGAGTGIWTRMLQNAGCRSVIAVEPNDDMRLAGQADSAKLPIQWVGGSAEETGLPAQSCDWLTMASSFHWANFDKATREFHRVLRPGGRFTALWNPRLVHLNPVLQEIEDHARALMPGTKRVSSGLSGITETLTEQLSASPYFEDVVYLEGRHTITMSRERYIGAWRSVNDMRVAMGPEKFSDFLDYVAERTKEGEAIVATYLTRAWSARRKD